MINFSYKYRYIFCAYTQMHVVRFSCWVDPFLATFPLVDKCVVECYDHTVINPRHDSARGQGLYSSLSACVCVCVCVCYTISRLTALWYGKILT